MKKQKLSLAIALVSFFLLGMDSAQNLSYEAEPVELQTTISEQELKLTAKFEDRSLFMGLKENSTMHYPGGWAHAKACTARSCTNGCTIGFGYNLGARYRKEVMRDLTPIIGQSRASELASYAHLRGKAAYRACGRKSIDKSTLPTLTSDESWKLLEKSIVPHKNAVVARIKKEGIEDILNINQVAVLVALDFQNPRLASKAKNIWTYLKNGDVERVAREILENSGSQLLSALQPRRDAEAELWLASL